MPEIEIRPGITDELNILLGMDHSYQTDYVWQMDRSVRDASVTVSFHEIRLPRPVQVDYPNNPRSMANDWGLNPSILTARMSGSISGYIRIIENYLPNTAWVTDMAVVRPLRGQGIASGLVLAAQEWAANRGMRRMIIEMQSKNYPAVHMAMKLGYEFSGYQDHFYANGDIALFFTRYLR
jgi:GNAT superfamily N-acetyltransferase